ncbi:MAG: PIN domain-containing protein [Hyphomicrobium sp.]|jgi:hypothetical protein
MPMMRDDEIQEAIDRERIGGLTLDTSIFDKYGCHLDFQVFSALGQFEGSRVAVLLSEMVVGEVRNHIGRDCEEAQRALKAAIKDFKKRWKTAEAFGNGLEPEIIGPVADSVDAQVSSFLRMSGATIVSATADAQIAAEVVRRYFALECPFENNKDKKAEFPDAFALLSLEADARARGALTLCLSQDKGWQKFCDDSDHLVCAGDLVDVLGRFRHAGGEVVNTAIQLWREGRAPRLVQEVEREIEYALDGIDFQPEAEMPTAYESNSHAATLQTLIADTATPPTIISSDADTVTFRTKVQGLVSFEAEFDAYSYDSLDKDNVLLGTATATKEDSVIFDLVLTVSRKVDGEPDVIQVDVAPVRVSIDFGYVNVFEDEDPTHEKY